MHKDRIEPRHEEDLVGLQQPFHLSPGDHSPSSRTSRTFRHNSADRTESLKVERPVERCVSSLGKVKGPASINVLPKAAGQEEVVAGERVP